MISGTASRVGPMDFKYRKSRTQRRFFKILAYTFALIIAFLAFFPFYTMVISATHDNYRITTQVNVLPGPNLVNNYNRLVKNLNIWRGFLNSAFVATCSTLLNLYFSALTAYAFSKFEFKGRNALFAIVLVTMMIPGQLGIIGFYKEVSDLKLLNSYIPLIIPSIASCFSVFFFKQYLDGGLPNEMIEAAIVDGCGEFRLFNRIVLPIMTPALATEGVLGFIGSWNSYMMPLIILNEGKKLTLPVLIATVRSSYGSDYGAQYIGILISVFPLLVIFSLASRIIMDKISVSAAIKG